jgi:hypothetical protein
MFIAYGYERGSAFAAALLFSSLTLGGCATSGTGSSLMDARAEAPTIPNAYHAIQDPPPDRTNIAMTPDERSKLKQELIAARDHQAAVAKTQGSIAPFEPTKP